jgi:hypothetical protein
MSQTGQNLPIPRCNGMSGIPPIATAKADVGFGRFVPLTTKTQCNKNDDYSITCE